MDRAGDSVATIGRLSAHIQQRLRDEGLGSVSATDASAWVLEDGLVDSYALGDRPIHHLLTWMLHADKLQWFPGARLEPGANGERQFTIERVGSPE